MKKNIVFSTTRQWNPGDEFILDGIQNVLKCCDVEYNAFIYNRHPDIRRETVIDDSDIRNTADEQYLNFVKASIYDNSIKTWDDWSFVDVVIIAGTPEWSTYRCNELYRMVIKYNLPIAFIGVDSFSTDISHELMTILDENIAFSTRNIERLFDYKKVVNNAIFMPCPAMLSTKTIKTVSVIKRIGLIFQGGKNLITELAGIDSTTYEYQNAIFSEIMNRYSSFEFGIICHYSDEVSLATKLWKGREVYYSYCSNDYAEIYEQFDLVIGCRIHGIGIATSLGIPAIPIIHDFRRGTVDGFVKDKMLSAISINDSYESIYEKIDYVINCAEDISNELKNYKNNVLSEYICFFKNIIIPNFSKRITYNAEVSSQKVISSHLYTADRNLYNIFLYENIIEVIKEINELIAGKTIVIRGAGQHTKDWLNYIDKNVRIMGIIDNNNNLLDGYELLRKECVDFGNVDYVLISSWLYEEEMTNDFIDIIQEDKMISIYKYLRNRGIYINNDAFFYLDKNLIDK